jgi:anti-sigma B factor antagonist
MMLQPHPLPLRVEQAGEVTLVTVTTPELGEVTIHAVARGLDRLIEGRGACRLRLNLEQVRYLTSTALGRFVALHKRLSAAGGQLTLLNVAEPVYELFALTRLDEVLDVRRPADEDACTAPLAS